MSDQLGMQDMGVNPGELDDDEGGGLVCTRSLICGAEVHGAICAFLTLAPCCS